MCVCVCVCVCDVTRLPARRINSVSHFKVQFIYRRTESSAADRNRVTWCYVIRGPSSGVLEVVR